MIKYTRTWLLALIIPFAFVACNKDDNNQPKKTMVEVLDETMAEWYLWNDKIPNLISSDYSSPNTYFEDLLVEQDKWSFIANLDQLMAYLTSGSYYGYGFDLKFEEGNDIPRVSLVYNESDLYDEGISRGWKLTEIDNQSINTMTVDQINTAVAGSSNTFTFENNEGEVKTLSLTKKEMNQNSVIKRTIIHTENEKVAYLVFDSFLSSSEEELNEAFDYFKAEGAEELVLDMRYNGGGSTQIAAQLASLISGNQYDGKVFSKYIHNDSKTSENFSDTFTNQASAYGFERVFIITTSATASSSELVINSLEPYMGAEDIILVGEKTHGKPVGMHVFQVPEFNLAILPITFHLVNKDDGGYFFDGIPVDFEIEDDITRDWGDIDETNLKAALDYINNDAFPVVTARAKKGRKREFVRKGLDELISAF